MKGEWCYYKHYFDHNTCQRIISEALKLPSHDGQIGVNGSLHTDQSSRRSKIRFIQKTDPNFTFLFDALWKMAIEANDTWFGFHISKLDFIQFAEYDESYLGEYKAHHDVFWMNNDPIYHRKLSAVIQLSDPSEYEGGNLELLHVDQFPNPVEIRTQGTVIFFPSFITHQATQVTKGTRYSIACWFDGHKWT